MAAVTTTYLVELAADLAGWSTMPADCTIEEPGTRLSSLLAVASAGPAEVFLARQLGYHAVLCAISPLRDATCGAILQRERAALQAAGLPLAPQSPVLHERLHALQVAALGAESERASAVARLVEQPLVCLGPMVAEVARRTLQERIDVALEQEPDASLLSLVVALQRLPAFTEVLPVPALGHLNAPAGGRVVVLGDLPAPGAEHIVKAVLDAGVTTLCVPELSSETLEVLRREGVQGNVLVLGRLSVLRAGMALYLARLRAEGIEVRSLLGGDAGAAPETGDR